MGILDLLEGAFKQSNSRLLPSGMQVLAVPGYHLTGKIIGGIGPNHLFGHPEVVKDAKTTNTQTVNGGVRRKATSKRRPTRRIIKKSGQKKQVRKKTKHYNA